MMRRTLAALGLVSAVALLPNSALAQALTSEAEARMHFEMGRRYYESGRFAESAAEFERAYALSPLPDLLYNLYLSYRDAGDDAHAADSLRRFVATLPEGEERRTLLEARLRTLDERLAARASGAPEPEPEPEPEPDPTPAPETTGSPAPSHDLAVSGGVLAGVGAVLALAAIGTGVAALDERSALAVTCPMNVCAPGFEGARDRGQALAIATDVLWVTGALTAVTGLVLVAVDLAGATEAPVAAALCTGDGCLAVVGGRL